MTRALTMVTALALALTCAFAGVAIAAPGDPMGHESSFDMGALSDRYESLKELGSSLTDEEGVVIATRIGVLVSGNRALNNSEVSFEGEVVGDVVHAGDGTKWANMQGTSNAVISAFITDEQAQLVQYTGDYHNTGTKLKVSGTYHIACPEHQGELDVHATSVEVMDSGGPVTHLVSPGKLLVGVGLCSVAVLLLLAYIFLRRYYENRDES